MNIREYMKAKHLTQREAAKLLDLDEGQLSRYLNGKTRPSLTTAASIEAKTHGQVTIASWMSDSLKKSTGA